MYYIRLYRLHRLQISLTKVFQSTFHLIINAYPYLVVLKLLTWKQTIHRKRLSNGYTLLWSKSKFQLFSLCYCGISWWNLNIYSPFLLVHIVTAAIASILRTYWRKCTYTDRRNVHFCLPIHFLELWTYIDWIRHTTWIAIGSVYLKLCDVCEANRNPYMEHEITSTICYNVHSVVFTNYGLRTFHHAQWQFTVVEKCSQRSYNTPVCQTIKRLNESYITYLCCDVYKI